MITKQLQDSLDSTDIDSTGNLIILGAESRFVGGTKFNDARSFSSETKR
jgi:hypothetical protein